MITDYFEAPCTLRRLRAPRACVHIDSFAAALQARGYTRWTTRGYLRAAAHFARWADSARLPVDRLDEHAVALFCDQHLPTCRCIKRNAGKFGDAVAGARHFVDHLRTKGVVPASSPRRVAATSPIVADFRAWMRAHRGATESTIDLYVRSLRDFLRVVGNEPSAYTPERIRAFVIGHARERRAAASKTVVSAVRALLRFLVATAQCPIGLDHAVPNVARWRLASLPRHLDAAAVDRVVAASAHAGRAGALRDHAVVLLLARLGLRAGDVAALQFDDIDWEAGCLRLRGKGRRETRLPLPQEVGLALAAYIERGRPACAASQVFLRTRAPVGPFASYVAVSDIARSALRRAGVVSPQRGAHVLRHSAATAMLRAGSSLDAIGAVLRHRLVQTTLQYAKVDVSSLSDVAQPWPEVASC